MLACQRGYPAYSATRRSQQHTRRSHALLLLPAGKAKILDSVRDVVALHKERHVFPVKIAVTKVSGSGQDSIFMGVIKPVPDDPLAVKVCACRSDCRSHRVS